MGPLLFLVLAAACMPLGGVFPFAYPLLLLALTFAFDRRAITTLGLRAVQFAPLGIAAGVVMFAVRVLAAEAFDIRYTWPMFAFMVSSVLAEELIFRGYAFRTFADQRKWTAIAVFAVLFAVYHWIQWNMWSNPQAMALTLLSTGLAHVLFALALLRSGTLWLPIGLHLGWNVSGQAVRLTGESFMTGYAISVIVLIIAVAVAVLIPPRARPLPAASP